ncbi:uncharacterized protein GGS22DRAFT_174495 [Annulohypoxylon maeteangense]|uniref:uncharacterized protein n=1 Tax=Annulohypoxylon maeteangense TaxID=1927788 RepID=UPI002007F7F9|nr:uncharacterized protein GGS22DRAFT_174495 [Annulohypoxylon maeteangense]KAI0880676.1 hypothetical protein GGS22DRAFT_174495 [Annulohypoxylon maeteangense]
MTKGRRSQALRRPFVHLVHLVHLVKGGALELPGLSYQVQVTRSIIFCRSILSCVILRTGCILARSIGRQSI